jgi:hypothetical protein
MSGVKGRSGKLTTVGQKASASERGKKGMAKRWGTGNLPPVPEGLDPTADDADARLGKPVTWGDELKRQQVEGERIQNRRRQVEVQRAEVELAKAQDERDIASGRQVTKEWHATEVRALSELFVSRLSQITDAALSLIPPEQQPAARHALDRAVDAYRKDVAAAAKDGTRAK